MLLGGNRYPALREGNTERKGCLLVTTVSKGNNHVYKTFQKLQSRQYRPYIIRLIES